MILDELKTFGQGQGKIEEIEEEIRQFRAEIEGEESGQECKNFEERLKLFHNDKAGFFKEINDALPPYLHCPNGLFRWDPPGQHQGECGEDQIPVSAIERKRLPFYSGYDLRVFDVGWPKIVPEYEQKHVENIRILFLFGYKQGDVTLVGGAGSIHAFNMCRLRLEKGNVFEYLRFFCAATWAAEGPFLVHSYRDFNSRPKRWEITDDAETAKFESEFRDWEKQHFANSVTKDRGLESKEADEQKSKSCPQQDYVVAEDPENPEEAWIGGWKISDVCMQYGRDAFAADFRVGRDGSVKMLDDWRIKEQGPIRPYRALTIGKERPVRALALRRRRQVVHCLTELRGQVAEIDKYWEKHSVLCLRGLHISDHVDLTKLVAELIPTTPAQPNADLGTHSEPASSQNSEAAPNQDRSGRASNCNQDAKLKGVVIDECLLGGALLAENLQCHGVFEVGQTLIAGRMSCQWLHCERDFRLEQVSIRNCNQQYPAFDASLAQIDEDVEIGYVRIGGDAVFARTEVKGDFGIKIPPASNVGQKEPYFGLVGSLLIHSAHAANLNLDASQPGVLKFGAVSLFSATIVNSLQIAGVDIDRTLNATHAHLGTCNLVATRIKGSVSMTRAEIRKDCVFNSIQIFGMDDDEDSMNLVLATIGGGVWVQHEYSRTEFAGGVSFSGIAVNSDIEIGGLKIGGTLTFRTGTASRLMMRFVTEVYDGKLEILPTEAREIDMSSVVIKGPVSLAGIKVGPVKSDKTNKIPAIQVNGCTFEELSFWVLAHWDAQNDRVKRLSRELPEDVLDPREIQALVEGNVELKNLSSTGICLSNLKVNGNIEIRDSHIKSNIEIGTSFTGTGSTPKTLHTECHSLVSEHLHCGGDGQFWGLKACAPENQGTKNAPVSVSVRNSYFGGSLCFCKEKAAEIEHRVDVSDCQAHRLEITGKGLRENWSNWIRDRPERLQCEETNPTSWLVLRGDKFDVLLVRGLVPVLVDFSGVEVGRWELDEIDEKQSNQREQEKKRIGNLTKLLRFSTPFNRSTYLSLERFLRDEGLDGEASDIIWAMRTRNPRSSPVQEALRDVDGKQSKTRLGQWLRAQARGLKFFPIVYPWHSASLVLAWLLVSWTLIFSVRGNVLATDLHYRIDPGCAQQRAAGDPCYPEQRHWGESFAMTVRYHIPPADFVMQDDWEPSPDSPTWVTNPRCWFAKDCQMIETTKSPQGTVPPANIPWWRRSHWRLEMISPLGYAILVAVVHWLLVPLTLIGIFLRMRVKAG